MKLKVLILDFDGVIVESNGIKDWAFEELFKEYPDRLRDIMQYHRARPAVIRFEKFRHITEEILGHTYSKEEEARLSAKFSELVLQKIIECPYVKGAAAFLEYFNERMPIYLVSVNPQEDLSKVLVARKLTFYFKKVYASPWLKKDAIVNILENERISHDETIFVGDAKEDYWAAQDAGIPFVGRRSNHALEGIDTPVFDDLDGVHSFLTEKEVKVA